jgi:hypothetical protein
VRRQRERLPITPRLHTILYRNAPRAAARRAIASGLALGLALGLTLAAGAARSEERVLRSFPTGGELGAVGVVDAATQDAEIEGPQAIFSGAEDELYLLDQVNGRVLSFHPKQSAAQTRSLTLPDGLRPTDMVVVKDDIYVWDGAPLALHPTGPEQGATRGLAVTRGLSAPDEATLSAFAQAGSRDLGEGGATRSLAAGRATLSRARQVVASHGRGEVVADLVPIKDKGVALTLRARDGAALGEFKMQVRSRIGAVELLDIDRAGRVYVLGENVPQDATDQPSTFVARYAANGPLEGVYELPIDGGVALTRRAVTISADGEVYFLRTRKSGTDLLGVGFRPLRAGQTIDLAPPAPPGAGASLADLARRKGAAAAMRPLTRARVIETARAFATVRWRVSAAAYGPDPDRACSGFNRIRRPGYLHGRLGQEVTGIPYCWGCHGSLPQIATLIAGGRLAGNVCTRNDPRPDVAGVDCSAFVSACWGLSTHFSTMAIPAIARELDSAWDLLPGDALNKPGSHVMLFMRFTPDRRAEVIESSTGGCNGKVCSNVYPLSSLLQRGYRPVRFRGLANDLSAPIAPAAPATTTARASAAEKAAPSHRPRRREAR